MSKENVSARSSAVCAPVLYLRKPSSLFGYVYIEVSPDGSNIGFRENQPREDFSYCLDKSGLGRINKFKLEA